MNRKLVSVVTGTYARPRLLAKCIQEVRNQTYPNIEHCIAHDGPAEQIIRDIVDSSNNKSNVPIKYVEGGRQWTQFLTNSHSAIPFRMAQDLSSGDYLMWLSDDEEITPDHIESLVDLLEKEDVDFVYSKTEIWFSPDLPYIFPTNVIGQPIPKCGNITQCLYRAELLDYAGFEPHVGSGTDWHQINTWMQAGASWAFLDRVTHTHRVDKVREIKTPKLQLRGKVKVRA
jgi:glycosyltransferase involved in cell wall biosynthesis